VKTVAGNPIGLDSHVARLETCRSIILNPVADSPHAIHAAGA
jgi:hypothetical protein